MSPIVMAVLSVTVIGIICAVVLSIASKVMAVKVDERFPAVRECLPGANCGACGYPGCDGYAQALIEDPEVKTNLCIPGAAATASALAAALGVEAEEVVPMVAVVHCNGNCEATSDKIEYHGMETCAAAKLMYGGKGACTFGCLGLGDCQRACPSEAICIENGIAHVDPRKCTGCGICTKECPNKIISVVKKNAIPVVLCSNTEKGAATRKKCTNGCIACKKCERECPEKAITVQNNLAVIDYSKCTNCGHCVEVCMAKCIKMAQV